MVILLACVTIKMSNLWLKYLLIYCNLYLVAGV
jgi:hypothetical protein